MTNDEIQELCDDDDLSSLTLEELRARQMKLDEAKRLLDDRTDGDGEGISNEHREELRELATLVEEEIENIRARIEDEQWIIIDGDVIEVDTVRAAHDEAPAMVEDGRREWYVDEDSETAGKRARAYYANMAENDPDELVELVGKENLVQWALGHGAGPGSTSVRSLDEWLDLWLDTPEETFASYDGSESDVDFCSKTLEEELGFKPTVAYRHN